MKIRQIIWGSNFYNNYSITVVYSGMYFRLNEIRINPLKIRWKKLRKPHL